MSGETISRDLKVEIRFPLGRRFVVGFQRETVTLAEAQEDAILTVLEAIDNGDVIRGYWGMVSTNPASYTDLDPNESAIVVQRQSYETISCTDPSPVDLEAVQEAANIVTSPPNPTDPDAPPVYPDDEPDESPEV